MSTSLHKVPVTTNSVFDYTKKKYFAAKSEHIQCEECLSYRGSLPLVLGTRMYQYVSLHLDVC